MNAAPALRQCQLDALEAIATERAAGHNRLLVKKPTGTGKTVTFAALLKYPGIATWLDTFPPRERKMLVIAHREELLDQAASKIQAANPELRVEVEQADRVATRFADVVCASIQTLSATRFRRLKALLDKHVFRIVIVDEAHHAAARTYRGALALLGFLPTAEAVECAACKGTGQVSTDVPNVGLTVECLECNGSGIADGDVIDFDDVAVMEAALKSWDARAPKDRLLVGVTATPNRSDAIGLGCVFQTIAYSYDLKKAIDDKYLVPIVPWVVETDTSLDQVRTNRGEFNQRDLADTVNTASRNQLGLAAWQEYAEDRATLAFTVDVAHAHSVAKTFEDAGVRAVALSGDTPREDRRLMLRQFQDRQLDIIANCMVLTEGTDLPITSCILHMKPTKSATLYEQMTGRGLRIHPGKEDCIVIDIVDIARRHSLQTAPVLYGLPPGLKAQGKTLKEVETFLDELLEKHPGMPVDGDRLTLDELHARAVKFDVWSVPPLDPGVAVGLAMRWVLIGEEQYRIQYPWSDAGGDCNESITATRDILGHYNLTLTQRVTVQGVGQRVTYESRAPRLIGSHLVSANAAMMAGEAFVREERRVVTRLTDSSAEWRQRPASPKQIALLRRMGAPIKPGLTMGDASAMIDRGKAMRVGR
jgi:superfamily II DNA or RNA helicase